MAPSQQAIAKPTATDELLAFARYLEFRTRKTRSIAYDAIFETLPPRPSANDQQHQNELDLLCETAEWARKPEDDWVELTEHTLDVRESQSDQDASRLLPPTPPGAIQQTASRLQSKAIEAAFEALGITGAYLELGLHVVAHDLGMKAHTADSAEEMVKRVVAKFPLIVRLKKTFVQSWVDERRRRVGADWYWEAKAEQAGSAFDEVVGEVEESSGSSRSGSSSSDSCKAIERFVTQLVGQEDLPVMEDVPLDEDGEVFEEDAEMIELSEGLKEIEML